MRKFSSSLASGMRQRKRKNRSRRRRRWIRRKKLPFLRARCFFSEKRLQNGADETETHACAHNFLWGIHETGARACKLGGIV